MTAHEAQEIVFRGLFLKGEVSGEGIIGHQTHAIASRIGLCGRAEKQQKSINSIVKHRAKCAREPETCHAPEVVLPAFPQLLKCLLHVLWLNLRCR